MSGILTGLVGSFNSAPGIPVPDLLKNEFSNGSGSTATSIVGPNITLTGSPSWTTGPKGTDGAVTFNGSTQSGATASAIAYGSNKITVCFSLWWDTYGSGDNLAFESSANLNSNDATFQADINDSANNLPTFSIHQTSSSYAASFLASRPSAAAWHHYAVVYDNSTTAGAVTIYVDGVLASSTPSSGTQSPALFSTQILYLMSRAGSSLFAAGKLAHLWIYSTALTSTQVTAVYNACH